MQLLSRWFNRAVERKEWVLILFCLIALVISIQQILLGPKEFWNGVYTHYNNYVIFKNSFFHLVENKNLYLSYPSEYGDLYKYSPTFAFLMSLFAFLPDGVGLALWNILNVLVFTLAVSSIPFSDKRIKVFVLLFVLFELILSTQNAQSNALMAGLLILAFNDFEKGKNYRAGVWLSLGTFIKLYSLAGCLLILLYPNKFKSISGFIGSSVLLFLLPLTILTLDQLIAHYENWFSLIRSDSSASTGMSFYAYTNVLFNEQSKAWTLLIGLILIAIPFALNIRRNEFQNRLTLLSLVLIWMVVFNPKAESPTFIIAMTGIAIWYFNGEKSKWKTFLCWASFFFTSVWFTDIVPRAIKKSMIDPAYIKGFFPCILFLFLVGKEIVKVRNVNNFISSDK